VGGDTNTGKPDEGAGEHGNNSGNHGDTGDVGESGSTGNNGSGNSGSGNSGSGSSTKNFWKEQSEKYGKDVADLFESYGDDGKRLIEKYGDDIVNATKDFAKSDAKEAIELINTYGDDALKMVKSKQSGNLVKEVCEGLRENNISYDDFKRYKNFGKAELNELKKTNKAEYDKVTKVMKEIRDRIKINDGTRMKKVLTDASVKKHYIGNNSNEVSGFVSRAEDSRYLSHYYDDVVETNRLDYLVDGVRDFPEGGNTHWEMEFEIANAEDMSQIKTPYGEHYGGTVNEPEPFKGSGYTGGRNDTTIAEWKIGSTIKIKDGATLTKYVDGEIVEQYKYSKDLKRWIKQ